MDADSKACPVCGETIKAVALKCRFCNTDLVAFAEKKELATEKKLFTGHPAVIYRAEQLFPFLAVLTLCMAVGYSNGAGRGILYGFLVFLIVSSAIYLCYYLISLSVLYDITTQRVKREVGLLSKKQESLELFRIDHFELRKPFGMRLLGQAELHLFSSDMEFENFYIKAVPRLGELSETLRECQLRERTRRGLTTFVRA